jgi:SET domain-containing protein
VPWGRLQTKISSEIEIGDSVSVREAPPKGLGLFATRKLPAGFHIGDYIGEKLRYKEYLRRYPNGESAYTFLVNPDDQRRDRIYIDAVNPMKSNFTRYINHDIHPNLDVRVFLLKLAKSKDYSIRFITNREINEDEELCFDYGPEYKSSWNNRV